MRGTLSIDLGSSTTVVAFQESGSQRCVLLDFPELSLESPRVIPSLVWVGEASEAHPPDGLAGSERKERGLVLVGRQVIEAGLDDAPSDGLRRDFKRWIGAPLQVARPAEASSPAFTAENAAALLIQELWQRLPRDLVIDRLVLAAPVDGYREYRRWLMETMAELQVPEVALVDEPTAAAIGAGVAAGSRLLVLDLGGGTIDVALVALEGGEGRAAPLAQLLRFDGRDLLQRRGGGQALRCARVLGKAGLRLGGRDVDRWIAHYLCHDEEPNSELLRAAEWMKCQLSDKEETSTWWQQSDVVVETEIGSQKDGSTRRLKLTPRELAAILSEHRLEGALDRLLEDVLAAGRACNVGEDAIDAVLTVGGSARLPLVQRWLQTRCARWRCLNDHPIEAVARGALALTPNVAIRDVLSRGVSLRTWDRRQGSHRWHPLFVAGQTTPTTTPLELVLGCQHADQVAIELVLGETITQQEREVIYVEGVPQLTPAAGSEELESARPWSVPPVALPLDPPGQPSSDRLLLRWSITASGELELCWKDLLSNTEGGPTLLGALC